jgi:hypothetical protein
MSEANIPTPGSQGGPSSRPSGDGLPPKTDTPLRNPNAGDAVDPGMEGEGDIGEDTGGQDLGGMIGEG